jgi:hypothetical protein
MRVSLIIFVKRQTVCIVGSGPSGLYSAKYLLKDDASIFVDVIDSLPSPFGEFFIMCPNPLWKTSSKKNSLN